MIRVFSIIAILVSLTGCTAISGLWDNEPTRSPRTVEQQPNPLSAQQNWRNPDRGPPDSVVSQMANPKGLNDRALFMEPVGGVDSRFRRLEQEVQRLRNDFDGAVPKLAYQVKSERSFEKAVAEARLREQDRLPILDTAQNTMMVAPHAPIMAAQEKPVMLQPAPDAQNTTASVSAKRMTPPPALKVETPVAKPTARIVRPVLPEISGEAVYGMRSARRANGARLVLDLSRPVQASVDIDNSEKLLIIEMPKVKWLADEQGRFLNRLPLKSYTVQSDDTATRLIISLSKPVKVATQKLLEPDRANNKPHRIFFDILPL